MRFRDVVWDGRFALACSRLTLARRTTVLFEGFVRREGRVWLPTRFGNSICYQILPFVSEHKLGPIRSGKSIGVCDISLMVSLIVDHVQK